MSVILEVLIKTKGLLGLVDVPHLSSVVSPWYVPFNMGSNLLPSRLQSMIVAH